jgi:hypothetical protein
MIQNMPEDDRRINEGDVSLSAKNDADENGEDAGKSVLIPTSMFPDAKPGDTVTMKIGQVFGDEMEAMPAKTASAKPTMPMSPSIEDDMRAEMMKG